VSVRLPTFLIVGAMRSGTTALARYLGAHPDVFVPAEKELHFFDRNFERGVDWYASKFARARGEHAIGEATQTYMYDPGSVRRLSQVVPDARLIAILRDPVDRAYSHYWLNRARGLEPLSFADAIAIEPERLASGDRRQRYVYSYLDRGRYLGQLQLICEYFPRSSLQVLMFDDLCRDPARTFEEVCGHLNVDIDYRPDELGRRINAHVTFKSPRLRRFAKGLPRPVARAIGRVNVRKGGYEPMEPGLRASINALFQQDVRALSDWLGSELPEWLDGG
jgi:sulfotransferase family protein